MDKIQIQVSGPTKSGKTTVIALITKALQDLGAEVQVQRCDPEIDEKLQKTTIELQPRLQGVQVYITELQTARVKNV